MMALALAWHAVEEKMLQRKRYRQQQCMQEHKHQDDQSKPALDSFYLVNDTDDIRCPHRQDIVERSAVLESPLVVGASGRSNVF